MKKILIHLGMGGHTSQILRTVSSLGPNYRYEYLIGYDDQTSTKKIKFPGKIYKIKNPRLMKDKFIIKIFFSNF